MNMRSFQPENKSYIPWIFFSIGVAGGMWGHYQGKYNLVVIFIMIIWLANLLVCFNNFKQNFVFFFFQAAVFTFLISRPFIGMCEGKKWWLGSLQANENLKFALSVIAISEAALFLGAAFADALNKKSIASGRILPENVSEKETEFSSRLQVISMLIFFITFIFYMIEAIEPLLMIGVGNYLKYYTAFESQLPGIIHFAASFMKYSLCIFLSTLPGKRLAFIPLACYVISTVPSLLIGVRNPFILSVLFCLTYYMLRDYIGDVKKKWLGKAEKILICVGVPVVTILMSIYSAVRNGMTSLEKGNNLWEMFVEFFYAQGVSFNVLSVAYGYREGLKIIKPVNYTFGGIIDYVYRGTIGQRIFGTEPLTTYNSDFNALNSNNLSHTLSKLYLREEYIAGRGTGSSYLIENYIDFGFLGVFIFSLVLGALLLYMVIAFGKRKLLSTIILVALMNVFFSPRAEATGWLTFIVTIQFWACVAGCYLAAYLCMKCKMLNRIMEKISLRSYNENTPCL